MSDTAETTFQPLHRANHGIGLNYATDDGAGNSLYGLYAKDDEGTWFNAAIVVVDNSTREISLSRTGTGHGVPTKGLASWISEGTDTDTPTQRISGRSVAAYVLPRAAVLLARLYTIA